MNTTEKPPSRNTPIPPRVALRAFNNYDLDPATGCHISRYSVASHGYAQIGWHGPGKKRTGTTAHRAAWVAVNGPIPDGFTIDHLCRNKQCVNVGHLRLLSNYENARRTFGRDWPLGTCRNGHGLDDHYRQPSGRIRCRPCNQAAQARYRAAVKAIKRAGNKP